MGFVAPAAAQAAKGAWEPPAGGRLRLLSRRERRTAAAALLFLAVVLPAVHFHEPWADEAQSWLLARDSSLVELWTEAPRYEGSPPLWHTVLHLAARLGLPYGSMNLLSALLGLAAAILLLRSAPWPFWIRAALPFTFFLSYQYSVVARSYSLLPPLLFGAAALGTSWQEPDAEPNQRSAVRWWLFTLVLCLAAATSVHGLVLSMAVWLPANLAEVRRWKGLTQDRRRHCAAAAAVYAAVLGSLAASAWPAPDATFSARPEVTWNLAATVAAATLADAFTGDWAVSLVLVSWSLPFLKRGGALAVFLLSGLFLLAVAVGVYSNAWHRGLLFLAWLVAMWIAGRRTPLTRPALLSLAAVTGIQCCWTLRSVAWDWREPYSGSRQAAAFLDALKVEPGRIHAVGFSSTSLQPYFEANRFGNWSGRRSGAFWDWSARNRIDDPAQLLRSRPAYLVAGYKSAEERERWARLARVAGYSRAKHFDGNLFWRVSVLEPEAFDVYRLAPGAPPAASSALHVADPAAADQLISGFHPVEGGGWRWTARSFSAALGRPSGAEEDGAMLTLRLFIPKKQAERLGAMTLSAAVNGRPLEPRTFHREGRYDYSVFVPGPVLVSNIVLAEFQFDRAVQPEKGDRRELAAIVASLELTAAGGRVEP